MPDNPLQAPEAGATPTMAQWFTLKAQAPDALLFLRMGDFYELFFDDAVAAAAALDIALSRRGEHQGTPIPMCGVPAHAAEAYLARLIRRGFRVAVAEQMEKPGPKPGRAPLRRELVRLGTPGTLTEDSLLEPHRPNLLLALACVQDRWGAAWVDVSTGLFQTAPVALADLQALLGRLEPAEIVAPASAPLGDHAPRRAPDTLPPSPAAARTRVAEVFAVASLDAFGEFSAAELVAAAQCIEYASAAGAGRLPRLSRPEPASLGGQMALDAATRASLEITRARDGGTAHTLLAAIDRTLTAPGARLLAQWLAGPLLDPAAIAARQDGWAWLLLQPEPLARLRSALRATPDLPRALGRLALGRAAPRDLGAVRTTLEAAADADLALAHAPMPPCLQGVDPAVAPLLARALADPLPARLDDGGVIAPGYDGELDAHRALRDDSRRVVAALALDFAQRYGVASLKIRHHAQLGYVIEAPTAAAERLREHPGLTLRQSTATAARFGNAELADLDRRITDAADAAAARERLVWQHLVDTVLAAGPTLQSCADRLASLDVLQAAARLAEGGRWTRPVITQGTEFHIAQGRHPVVEAALGTAAAFMPNACDLSPNRALLLLTGPNMAGKSTYLRQNALIAILAQAGLPVPAGRAKIGIVDRLFSRVGAADDLARGRSTFMVEMTETAAILNQAGPRSLVIVDEIGRGTGTLDGLAIAWAVLEALHAMRARTLFATHFHELARLAPALPRLRPHTMRVKEHRGSVVFLHEVAEGAAGRSWGVHVAGLAGVPSPTVRRAAALLAALERQRGGLGADLPLFADLPTEAEFHQHEPHLPEAHPHEPRPYEPRPPEPRPPEPRPPEPRPPEAHLPAPDPLHQAVAAIEPDRLSPREALDLIYRLRELLTVSTAETSLD